MGHCHYCNDCNGFGCPWTQNIRFDGSLSTINPADRPQAIHATIGGRIVKWYVREGQLVHKADTIVSLSEVKEKYFDPELITRLREQLVSKEASFNVGVEKVAAYKRQIAALKAGLTQKQSQIRNKIKQGALKVQSDSIDLEAEKVAFAIATRQFNSQENLYKQGLKSLTELEERRQKLQQAGAKLAVTSNKWNISKNEYVNTLIELNSTLSEYQDKIAKAESELNSTLSYQFGTEAEISKMKNELANTTIRSSFYQITAPRDGYVSKAIKSGLGETIKEGEAVASIVAKNPAFAAELFVKPMDLPLLAIGNHVRLQFDGWPALVFSGWPSLNYGTFGGTIAMMDFQDTKGKYRILVVPDNKHPWPSQLRLGTGVHGWALLKDVPVYYEIWRQLNGFPPDYMDQFDTVGKDSGDGKPDKPDKKEVKAE